MCTNCGNPETKIVADLTPQNAPAKAADFIRDALPAETYPETCFAGRGVVIAAGGLRYGVCAWVAIRALRYVGCELPIEVWYRGPAERVPGLEDLTAQYQVDWVDAFAMRDQGRTYPSGQTLPAKPHARLNGFETKPFAIQWSRFEQVLFVDADNVAITDPTYLFSDPNYLETGTVLWPDYATMAPSLEAWDVFGLREYASAGGGAERCVESGQILIDKRRAWPALCLAHWYGERSVFFFRYVYGDKELFHLAWRRLGLPYAMPARGIQPLSGTMCQHDFSGQRVFQHRNFEKWNLTKNTPRPGFLLEAECLSWLEELKSIWSPAAETFATAEDRAQIAALENRRYRYVRVGHDERPIRLGPAGQFAEGGATCETYWTMRGGRLRIADAEGHLIMELDRQPGESWKGRWLLHERMPIELVPLP
jgi:hypothetical protein